MKRTTVGSEDLYLNSRLPEHLSRKTMEMIKLAV